MRKIDKAVDITAFGCGYAFFIMLWVIAAMFVVAVFAITITSC